MTRALHILWRAITISWVGAGLALPFVLGIVDSGHLRNDQLPLALVLFCFAVAGSNVELRFSSRSSDGDGPVFSPVGVPIVLAAIACTPAQAMLVTSLGFLLDRATWRHSRRLAALETAGLGAMSALGASLLADQLGLSFDGHASTMVAAVVGSIAFLLLDALTYATLYQLESRSGADVLRYFVRAAPVDVTFTAIAVMIAGPFHDSALAVAGTLIGCQLAIYALYRMITSEARHREQSHHLRDTFGRYVPQTIVDQLASSVSPVRLGGESRDVSVLFVDIRGFTSWAEHHEPEDVVRELNGLLGGFAQAVMDSGGTLDKFLGDGLMAFWGAPLEQPDHAERACTAARSMQDLVAARESAAAAGECTAFRIGIGISSGAVVVGNLGHEERLEYTAIGDTVNLAARLEQATKEFEATCVVAHETWEMLPARMQAVCPELGTIQVRGRTRETLVHQLLTSAEAEQVSTGDGDQDASATAGGPAVPAVGPHV